MVKYHSELYAAGQFYNYPGFTFCSLAKYDGTTWTPVGNGVNGGLASVGDMVVYKDTLYIAGAFSKADGNMGTHIMKWDGSQLRDAGFGNFYDWGGIWQLAVYKNRLFAFGNFDHAADQTAFGVAYYENGQWTVPQDNVANYGIRGAVVYKDELYISGGFQNINGDTTLRCFAKLRCIDFDYTCTVGLKDHAQTLQGLKVYPNPAQDQLSIELETAGKIDLQVTNCLGQVVYTSTSLIEKQNLDLGFLQPGIYFLSLRQNNGQKTIKIIKE
jgi:hypothetical protein